MANIPKIAKELANQKKVANLLTFKNSPVKKLMIPAKINKPANAPEARPMYLQIACNFIIGNFD